MDGALGRTDRGQKIRGLLKWTDWGRMDGRTGARRVEVDVRTVKNLKLSPKGRTDLKILPSKAKNLEEFGFDVRKSLAPRKSAENNEKPKNKSEILSEKVCLALKNRNLQIV